MTFNKVSEKNDNLRNIVGNYICTATPFQLGLIVIFTSFLVRKHFI